MTRLYRPRIEREPVVIVLYSGIVSKRDRWETWETLGHIQWRTWRSIQTASIYNRDKRLITTTCPITAVVSMILWAISIHYVRLATITVTLSRSLVIKAIACCLVNEYSPIVTSNTSNNYLIMTQIEHIYSQKSFTTLILKNLGV